MWQSLTSIDKNRAEVQTSAFFVSIKLLHIYRAEVLLVPYLCQYTAYYQAFHHAKNLLKTNVFFFKILKNAIYN